MDKLGQQLSAKFDQKEIKTRKGGYNAPDFVYASINSYVNRINDVTGTDDVSLTITDRTLEGPISMRVNIKDKKDRYGKTYISETVDQYFITVIVKLRIKGSERDGIGSSSVCMHSGYDGKVQTSIDMDTANKTALANAVKKAAFYFGIGAYLWDQEERDLITHQQHSGYTTHQTNTQPPVQAQPSVQTKPKAEAPTSDPIMDNPMRTEVIAKLKKVRQELALNKVELAETVKEFFTKEYKEENNGSPDAVLGKTDEESKARLEKLIEYIKGK